MNAVFGRSLIVLLLLGPAVGCFSPGKSAPPRFYVLSPAGGDSTGRETTRTGNVLLLLPLDLPELLDRPQMVVRSGTNEVRILEFDRWAEPLEDGIELVLLDDLASALPNWRLYRGVMSRPDAEHLTLRVRIESFEPGPDAFVYLRAWWTLRDSSGTASLVERRSEIREPIPNGTPPPGDAYDAAPAVEAMNRALVALAREIATAVREEAP